MPWKIEERDGKYCVVKIATGETVKCHATRNDALKHQKALYANDPSMKYSIIAFSDNLFEDTEDENTKWVKTWRYSSWDHPKYGKVEITPQTGMRFKQHFDDGALGREHLVNYDHGVDAAKGGKAGGQILAIEPRDDGIYYKVKFTPTALTEILNGEWKYVSPEYDDWLNPETGEIFEDMPFDLALTNTPFFKGLPPLNFSEIYTEEDKREFADWSAAYKNDLPDSSFLYISPGGKKDSEGKTTPRDLRHFPYKDKDGKIDIPHLRNAIARIPQADIPASLKDSLQAKARRLLGNAGGSPKGGKAVDELLRQFAERFGVELTDEMDEDAILAKAEELNAAIEPLRKAKGEAERTRTFREAFPDEYKEMEKLKKTRVESEAKAFSENYRRFTITAGDREYKSTHGFSELVLDQVTEAYKKFSDRSASPVDLKKLLDLIGDKGIVDYSESGSARGLADREWSEDPKQAFAEAVQRVMEEDNVPYEAAMTIAMQKHQDLYEEYLKAIPQR